MLLRLEGDCTVGRAEELHAMLLRALEAGELLELDFSGVTAMDLSFGQLVHALKHSCETRGVEYRLAPNLPTELGDQAVCCGLPSLVGLPDAETGLNTGAAR